MTTDTTVTKDPEALAEELELAEEQLFALSKLAVQKHAQYHKKAPGKLSLGKNCGVSLCEMMSLSDHAELVEDAPASLCINKGVSGHAAYGPYVALDAGSYEIILFAKGDGADLAGAFGSPSLTLQIAKSPSGEIQVESKVKPGNHEKPTRIPFEVKSADERYEFRLSGNGRKTISITRFDLWRVG